jgi:hypothetical protein
MPRAVVMNLLRPSGPYISRVGLGTASGSTPLPAYFLVSLYNRTEGKPTEYRKYIPYIFIENRVGPCVKKKTNETDLTRSSEPHQFQCKQHFPNLDD